MSRLDLGCANSLDHIGVHATGASTLALTTALSGAPLAVRPLQRIVRRTSHQSSRCTVVGENAGRHTAMYSAPLASGVL